MRLIADIGVGFSGTAAKEFQRENSRYGLFCQVFRCYLSYKPYIFSNRMGPAIRVFNGPEVNEMQAAISEQMGMLAQFLPSMEGSTERRSEVSSEAYRVLIMEGSVSLARLLATGLSAESLTVEVMPDLHATMRQMQKRSHQLLILDMDHPDVDGLALLRILRTQHPHMRVLVLSGRVGFEGLVAAFDHGADDYLMKPFSLLELVARVRALRRRANDPVQPVREQASKLVLHPDQCRVERGGCAIDLTPREFALLEFMMQHAGKTLSRAMLTAEVWKMDVEANTNIVDVYIKYLRDKLDEGHSEKLIRTVRGIGYVFQAQT